MRALLRILIVLVLLWTGYWGVVWWGLAHGLPSWMNARQGEGWQAEVGTLDVSGFPVTFRSRLTDVALADPDTGLAWRAPELLAEASALAPLSLRVSLPALQTVASPFERIDVSSTQMEASLALAPDPDLPLKAATIRLTDVDLTSTLGWSAALSDGTLTASRTEDEQNAYDITFTARDARPSAEVLRRIDRAGLLPPLFEQMDLRARAAFDAPWDRRAIEERRPQPRRLELNRLAARWGDVAIEAAGDMTIDADGLPEGRISLRIVNWRDVLGIAVGNGWVPERLRPTAEAALGALAGMSGGPDTLDAPLSFQSGFMSLGPVPLGPAPRLILR